MRPIITIKIGDIIINDYYQDYRFCVIEQEREDTPQKRRDNFETPEPRAASRMVWVVKLRGYEHLGTITIFKDVDRGKAVGFQNEFFKKLFLFHSNTPFEEGKVYFIDIFRKEEE